MVPMKAPHTVVSLASNTLHVIYQYIFPCWSICLFHHCCCCIPFLLSCQVERDPSQTLMFTCHLSFKYRVRPQLQNPQLCKHTVQVKGCISFASLGVVCNELGDAGRYVRACYVYSQFKCITHIKCYYSDCACWWLVLI